MAAGFLLLLIGVSGRLPNRLKIGDNEAEWYTLLRLAQETAETTAEATATKAVNSQLEIAMRRLAKSAPKLAESMSILTFFLYAKESLNAAIAKMDNANFEWHKVKTYNYEIVSGVNGKKAYCEIVSDVGQYDLAKRRSQILLDLTSVGVDRILLITNGELPRATRATVINDPLIETIELSYEDDENDGGDVLRLSEVLTSLLELARS